MTLRKKTLLVTGLTMALLMLVLYGASRFFILNNAAALEESLAAENMRRVLSAVFEDISRLDATAFDWATWDETYAFMEKVNGEYVAKHLADPNFSNLRLNFMLFANPQGEVVFGKGFDLSTGQETPWPESLAGHLRQGGALYPGLYRASGFLLLPEGPVLVASRQVLTSAGTGPSRGVLVVGRFFSAAELSLIAERVLLPVEQQLYAAFQPEGLKRLGLETERPMFLERLDSRTMAGFAVLSDLYGRPALVLLAKMPREIYLIGKEGLQNLLFSVLLTGLVLGGVVLLFLEKNVLSRILKLSSEVEQIGKQGDLSRRLEADGRTDELSFLKENINGMLRQLERSRQRDLIAENMLDMVLQIDPTGTISYASPSHKPLLGYEQADLLGKSCFELVHPDDLKKILDAYHDFLQTQTVQRQECRCRNAQGRYVWVEIMANPIFDEAGQFCGAILSSRDISERKAMEEQLRFLSLYDSLTGLYNRTYFEQEMRRLQSGRHDPVGIIICDLDGLKFFNDSLGHGAGDSLLKAAASVISGCFRENDVVARIGGDEFAILLPGSSKEVVENACQRIQEAIDAYNADHPKMHLSISIGFAVSDGKEKISELFKRADNSMYREKLHRSRSARSATVQVLMKALQARDFLTEEHVVRLQGLVVNLARAAGIPEHKMTDMRLLAQFHDIGKVGIPDRILLKPGVLDQSEREEMKRHCEIGHRIAQAAPDLAPIADWVLKHHEWWDGSGYPFGLKKEEIPLECRVLAVADAYDAMTSDRPYRNAMSHREALEELQKFAGIQFDPHLVDIFVEIMQQEQKTTSIA